MLEMCSGTSNYPWVTIWDIRMAYFGRSVAKSEKNPKLHAVGGGKKKNSQQVEHFLSRNNVGNGFSDRTLV